MIRFEDVQIKYGDNIVIDNLNLHIQKGEFFTFLGASGCGKTTTLRALAGFLQPSKGNIYVEEKSVVNVPIEKRGIGVIFQNYALFPTMNVYENIAFGLRVKKVEKQEVNKAVCKVADMVEIAHDQLKKNISELSGGQQQRVAIARALVHNPRILLLDEPLSNLDAKLRKQLRKELKKIQTDFGITSVYVTHDQDEALTLSDRIAVFYNGKIEQVGSPRELYDNASTEYVCNFIGDVSRLGPETVREIAAHSSVSALKKEAASYIRTEKVCTEPNGAQAVALTAEVAGREFYGTHSIYTYAVFDSVLKGFRMESGQAALETGERTTIYINPACIMQY